MNIQVRPDVKKEIEDTTTTADSTKGKGEGKGTGGATDDDGGGGGGGLATIQEVFSFVENSRRVKVYIIIGSLAAIVSGLCFPAMAWLFSNSFSDLSALPSSENFLQQIRQLVTKFLILGVVMFVMMTIQATFLEAAASQMTQNFKKRWFESLLRQDMAYFDICVDISGTATIIGTNGLKFHNGIGYKFANGIQFTFVCIGGIIYGFYSCWQISLLILTIIPFMVLSSKIVLKLNQTQSSRANETYSQAGSIVYTTVTSIRTILSLNAVETIVETFEDATEHAYMGASSQMIYIGIANGSVMGSFLLAYFPLILYGSYLLYDNISKSGCDPSGSIPDNITCEPSAAGVFGALMGITFGGSTLPQVSASVEAFMGARAAAYPALVAISRRSADPDDDDETKKSILDKSEAMQRRRGSSSTIAPLVLLPKYDIDSSSPFGIAPNKIRGRIRFNNVKFAYPTRPDVPVLDGFSLDIQGTVAIVGKSGCGKSTILSLVERFYDPLEGTISLDGTDIRLLNLKWLRKQIGIVSQEPKLFSTTIKENIRMSCPTSSNEEVEAAAKKANAHEFIIKFPDGYDTQVGHEGTKISGGQKQRIALARILIRQPKVIVLDEATSALDSESESVVQEALDNIIKEGHQTIIVIAHRLSTIKNADTIVVLESGKIVEQGKHDELMLKGGAYADLVEAQQGIVKKKAAETGTEPRPAVQTSSGDSSSKSSGSLDEVLPTVEDSIQGDRVGGFSNPVVSFLDVHFHYPTRPDALIFKGLNLDVREGETLGICGPSGQGKSTIIQLLETFYYPTKGTIKYLGVDTKDLNIKWMREQMSLVSQEPVLFDTTIEENIRFGMPHATHEQVEMAARQANAHDFIMAFPDRYKTTVGASSTKISGGQKQRIAIARAIIRRPKLLLLDEATSNLDSESEGAVQDALEKIMSNSNQTTIIIAHRLSTIRRADRIAVINKGKVIEIGSHHELMALPRGKYKHLHELQDLGQSQRTSSISPKKPLLSKHSTEILKEGSPTAASQLEDDKEKMQASKATKSKAKLFSKGNEWYFAVGGFGAILAGLMFPGWGFVFAYMIETLYNPVSLCDEETGEVCVPLQGGDYCENVGDCEDYYNDRADEMQQISFKVAYGLISILLSAIIGHSLVWYGFGTASERINKRVRDDVFESLVRQEVGWFDQQSVGDITSQLSDDASKIHAFSGEPIRSLVLTLSSLLVGLVVSLFFMWPFALMALATLPFMAFAAKAKMEMFMGKDEGVYDSTKDDVNSSGGIVIETLSNIRTVASLALEDARSAAYGQALSRECPTGLWFFVLSQGTAGLGQLVRTWAIGFYFWWGGWLMNKYPNTYEFRDFLISMFSLLISISGMSVAMQGLTDKDEASAAANRIFELLERESEIDPLSDKGLKEAAVTFPASSRDIKVVDPPSKSAGKKLSGKKKTERLNSRKSPNPKSRKEKDKEATKSPSSRRKKIAGGHTSASVPSSRSPTRKAGSHSLSHFPTLCREGDSPQKKLQSSSPSSMEIAKKSHGLTKTKRMNISSAELQNDGMPSPRSSPHSHHHHPQESPKSSKKPKSPKKKKRHSVSAPTSPDGASSPTGKSRKHKTKSLSPTKKPSNDHTASFSGKSTDIPLAPMFDVVDGLDGEEEEEETKK